MKTLPVNLNVDVKFFHADMVPFALLLAQGSVNPSVCLSVCLSDCLSVCLSLLWCPMCAPSSLVPITTVLTISSPASRFLLLLQWQTISGQHLDPPARQHSKMILSYRKEFPNAQRRPNTPCTPQWGGCVQPGMNSGIRKAS